MFSSLATTPATPPAPLEFDAVYRAQVGAVWRALSGLGVRGADLHDACQEVFLVVHRRLPEFDGRHKVSTWIHAICINVAYAWRRRAAKREPLVDADATATTAHDPERELSAREAADALRRLLDVLDDDKRAIFVLYEVGEMSMREVAEAVGCPLQTAYSRYHAARKLLDRELADRPRPQEAP